MAGGAPPPYFSSFPQTHPPKPPAPAFSSFPSPPRPARSDSPPPTKRSRAVDFLDSLGTDLGIPASGSRSSASRHRRDDRPSTSSRRRHDDDNGARDRDGRRKHGSSSSRRDRSVREPDEDRERRHRSSRDEDGGRRHGERERRRDDDGSKRRHDERKGRDKGKGKEREVERDSDYGPKVRSSPPDLHVLPKKLALTCRRRPQRSKPYQLVQAPCNDEDDTLSVALRSERDDESSATDKPLFYESRRGDENNLRYGGLHRGDVPKYRRLGGGRVVGLNKGLRITRETAYTGRGIEVAPLNRFRVRPLARSSPS